MNGKRQKASLWSRNSFQTVKVFPSLLHQSAVGKYDFQKMHAFKDKFSLYSGIQAQSIDVKNKTIVNSMSAETDINCTDPFFFSNGTCLPLCDKWKQYSNEKSDAIDVIAILSALSGFTFGIIGLVLSCIGRKKM